MDKRDIVICHRCGAEFERPAPQCKSVKYCPRCRVVARMERKDERSYGKTKEDYTCEIKCFECGTVFHWWNYRRRLCDDCLSASVKETRQKYKQQEGKAWKNAHEKAFDASILRVKSNSEIERDAKKRAKKSQKPLTEDAKMAHRMGLSYGQMMAMRYEKERL